MEQTQQQMGQQTMQAIGFRRYGRAEVLEALEVTKPNPGPGEVLLRVAAAGVNPADWALRSGQLRPFVRLKFPFVPGSDIAGVVEAVGPGASRFRPGDAVFAMTPSTAGGGYAEFVRVSEADAALVPENLTLSEAVAVPLAALTALQALRDKAGLRADSHALVYGASGGVGSFAVQISKAIGARVTAVSSGRNEELVRGLGADEVLDYEREDVLAGGGRYDVVFDAVNAFKFGSARRVLREGGVYVTVNPLVGALNPGWLARIRGGRWVESVFVRPSGKDLEKLAAWIQSGKVRPIIDRSYGLSDAAEAHRYSETRRARGKILLLVDEDLATTRAAHRDEKTHTKTVGG
jgi:NADPH:quinone reductase-like Zn-dependent oxidoreductase